MNCLNPLLAVSIYKNTDNKHVLKFMDISLVDKINDLKQVYGDDNVFLLPCGKCKPCRIQYSQEWGLRCSLEAEMHKHNYFLTLTYRSPFDKFACKKDFDKFIDRLQYFDSTIKFFACMESGELTHRKHFHCVLFMDKDLDLIEPVQIGAFYHYHSKVINEKWEFGLHDITPFETDCAAYVAKYTSKDGKIWMSRNLGKSYFEKYKEQIIRDGLRVYGNFGKDKVSAYAPKCFIRWLKEDNSSLGEDLNNKKKSIQKNKIIAKCQSLAYSSESDYLANTNRDTKKILKKMKDNRNEFD